MKSCLAAALTLLAVVSAPAQARQPIRAQALSDPARWVGTEDYPAVSLRLGEEGTSGFLLSIDKQGRVTNCIITISSGHEALDNATCALLAARARFAPARDRHGRPEAGTFSSSVRWVVPRDPSPGPPAGDVLLTFTVDADGSVRDCSASGSGPLFELEGKGANACARGMGSKMAPYMDQNGIAVPRRVTMRITTTVEAIP